MISGKFYPLQTEEWLKDCHELRPAEKDVLYYLRTLDCFESISVTKIAEKLGRNKGTVSRALKVLKLRGYITVGHSDA